MSNRFCNITGSTPIKDNYSNIEEGFDLVEAERDAVDTRIDGHVDGSSEKHNASEIVDDSGLGTANLKLAVDALKSEIDALTVGDSNALVGTYNMIASGSDTITATYTDLTYYLGLKILSISDGTNETEAVTYNINSLGAKSVKSIDEAGTKVALTSGAMPPLAFLYYDGTDFILVNGKSVDYSDAETIFAEVSDSFPKCVGGKYNAVEKGQSLVNGVVNGDFSDGTSDWTPLNSSVAVSSGVLSNTGDGTKADSTVFNTNTVVVGDVYFIYMHARVTNPDCTKIQINEPFNDDTVVSPAEDEWYEVYKKGEALYSGLWFRHYYATAGDQNGAVMEVDGNAGVFAINMTALGIEAYTEAQMLDIVRCGYFEGVESAHPKRLTSRTKNLVKNNTNVWEDESSISDISEENNYLKFIVNSSNYFKQRVVLEPNTEYTLSAILKHGNTTGQSYFIDLTDEGGTVIDSITSLAQSGESLENNQITTTTGRVYYIQARLGTSSNSYYFLTKNIQLEEGLAATSYVPFDTSKVYTHGESRSLPNGVSDEEDIAKGVKVWKTEKYIPSGSDFTLQTGSNAQSVYMPTTLLEGLKPFSGSSGENWLLAGNFAEDVAAFDSVDSVGKMSNNTNYIQFVVALGTYTDTADAQANFLTDYGIDEIIYERATYVTENFPPQAFKAFPSGSILKENAIEFVGYNDTGIIVDNTDYPIAEVESVEKINEDGSFDPVDYDDFFFGDRKLLSTGDMTSLVTSAVNNDRVLITKPTDWSLYSDAANPISGSMVFGTGDGDAVYNDDTDTIGKIVNIDAANYAYVFAKGAYASLSEVQDALRNTPYVYETSTNAQNYVGVAGSEPGERYLVSYKYSTESAAGELEVEYPKNESAAIEGNSEMINSLSKRIDVVEQKEAAEIKMINYYLPAQGAGFTGFPFFRAPEDCQITKITMLATGFSGIDASNILTITIINSALDTVATRRFVANISTAGDVELSLNSDFTTLAKDAVIDLGYTSYGGTVVDGPVNFVIEYISK